MQHISAKTLQEINHVNSRDPIWQPLKLNSKPFVFEVDMGSPDNSSAPKTLRLDREGSNYNLHTVATLQPMASHCLLCEGSTWSLHGIFRTNGAHWVQRCREPAQPARLRGQLHVIWALMWCLCALPCDHLKDRITSIRFIPSGQVTPWTISLQKICQELCSEFLDLFKLQLECLKDFELEIKFKLDARPYFLQTTHVTTCSSG